MNTGARIHGLDVNQGNQLNGAQVCSCSTNSVSPFTGITWTTAGPSRRTSTWSALTSLARMRYSAES